MYFGSRVKGTWSLGKRKGLRRITMWLMAFGCAPFISNSGKGVKINPNKQELGSIVVK